MSLLAFKNNLLKNAYVIDAKNLQGISSCDYGFCALS